MNSYKNAEEATVKKKTRKSRVYDVNEITIYEMHKVINSEHSMNPSIVESGTKSKTETNILSLSDRVDN